MEEFMHEIREIRPDDYAFLGQLLYQALYSPTKPLPLAIINEPGLAQYVTFFGQAGDEGVVLTVEGHVVGAAWTRLWTGTTRGYGFVDASTPELAMALEPAFRGKGYGQRMLLQLMAQLQAQAYRQLSLSVHKHNRALHLYQRLGFQVVREEEGTYTMLRKIKQFV
jgi:ribosomal protein S18 acetylase RimI-like enzyme